MDKHGVMQDLYDSEINVSVASFWDGGWHVKLGDETNGFLEETTIWDRWDDVLAWIRDAAVRHFPDSTFAKKYAPTEEEWDD